MQNFYQSVKIPFALTSLCLMLSACGGGSNNINENPGSSANDDKVIACTSNCVTVVLDETPVQNVNYTCGNVRGVTDNLGTGECPVDALVSYFLKAKGGTKRINLGTSRKITTVDYAQGTVRFTLKDLAESTNNTTINSVNEPGFTTAINLSRFLYSLNGDRYIETAPLNRILISTETLQAIDKIDKDINASDFKDDSYIAKVQPLLTALNKTLISKQVATDRLLRTLNVANSGTVSMTPDTGAVSFGSAIGGSNNSGDKFVTLATYNAINRTGKTFGFGAHWIGTVSSDADKLLVYIRNSYTKLDYDSGTIDPVSHQLTNFNFKFSEGAFKDSLINFSGKLFNDSAIVYSANQLKNVLGQEPTADDLRQLGKWQQNTVPVAYQGNLYLTKADKSSTFFDDAVWKVKDSVETGKSYYFPLYFNLNIKNKESYLTACKALPASSQPVNGCQEQQTVPLVILENGDIYTDFPDANGNNCGVLDTSTMRDDRGVAQYAVGTVRGTRFDAENAKFIFPYMIFAGEKFKQMGLDGMLIGSNGLELRSSDINSIDTQVVPIFKINLAGLDSRTGINATATDDPSINSSPKWVNLYNYYTALTVALAASGSSGTDTSNIPTVTDVQKANAQNTAGDFSVKVASCYAYPVK